MTITATISKIRRSRRARPGSVLVSASWCMIGLIVLVVIAGPWIAPHDPNAQDPLLSVTSPSFAHPFGTDQLGRDILSRLIVGTRAAMFGPICVAVASIVLGLFFGMIAGFRGGWADTVIARTADILYCLPALLIAIVVVGLISGSYLVTIAVLIFLTFPYDVRIIRSVTMVEARLPYVDAARTLGVSGPKTMVRHILPNIMPTAVATLLLEFAGSLVGFSALAFLGLGVQAGSADWGSILADGQEQLFVNPAMALAPATLLILVAASVTIVGDSFYDRYSAKGARDE